MSKLFKSGSSSDARVFFFESNKPTQDSTSFIKTKKDLKMLALSLVNCDPDSCYQKAGELYKTLITTQPANDIDDAWWNFKKFQEDTIQEYGELVKALIHSTDCKDLRKVMSYVTLIGLLFRNHLVETETVYTWIESILLHQTRPYFRTGLMIVIKDKVKESIENGVWDNGTSFLNKVILDHNLYEEEERDETASKEEIVRFQRLNRR